MNYGIWSGYFIEYPPEKMVELFSSKELYKLEFSDEHGSMLLDRGNPELTGKNFKTFANDYGISFPQGHLLLKSNIVDSVETETVDTLKRWLDLFLTLDIKAAVLHPGGKRSRKDGVCKQQIRMKQLKVLKQLTDYIKHTDMTICLENIPETEKDADDLLEIIELSECNNLGICLDTGHLNIVNGDQEKFILKAGKYLKALHIADNEGFHDQHMMPYGKGNVNWTKVVSGLERINYNGLFNLEIPGERTAPLDIKLAKLDYLKTILPIMLNQVK